MFKALKNEVTSRFMDLNSVDDYNGSKRAKDLREKI